MYNLCQEESTRDFNHLIFCVIWKQDILPSGNFEPWTPFRLLGANHEQWKDFDQDFSLCRSSFDVRRDSGWKWNWPSHPYVLFASKEPSQIQFFNTKTKTKENHIRAKISKSGKRRKSFFCNNFFKIVQNLIL